MLSLPNFNITHYLDSFHEEQRLNGIDVWFDPFTYEADFTPLVTLTTDRRLITIEGDADFFLTQTSSNLTGIDILVRLRDESRGRELQNTPVQLDNLFGSGSEPFFWYKPLYLQRRSALMVELVSGHGSDQTVRLAFHGVKVFTRALPAA